MIACYFLFMREVSAMPRIMIGCPRLKVAVPTGYTTEMVKLDSMFGDMKVPFKCPPCGGVHNLTRDDAWIEKRKQRRKS
jgi:hypothetical protein